MSTATATSAPYATLYSRLGVYAGTTHHHTVRAAEMAARHAIKSGKVDSAAVWTATEALSFFGSGR